MKKLILLGLCVVVMVLVSCGGPKGGTIEVTNKYKDLLGTEKTIEVSVHKGAVPLNPKKETIRQGETKLFEFDADGDYYLSATADNLPIVTWTLKKAAALSGGNVEKVTVQ